MLVGYEANNPLRRDNEIGDFGRELIARMAKGRVGFYRALLFSTWIKEEFHSEFVSYSNISTYLPVGMAKFLPAAWFRYGLNPLLQSEKVRIFHGLNEELPYGIGRNIKTIITCYGAGYHCFNSLLDRLAWRWRMKYSFRAADVIVAVSDEVKSQLVAMGVEESRITVIGIPGKPFEVNDDIVEQYLQLYKKLAGQNEN